jgi:2-aminoethylphosphonate-pyruvate transaminase
MDETTRRARAEQGDSPPALLLTPGPLTTSPRTRRAMDRDWGSRDSDFIALTARVRERLARLCGAVDGYSCVPIQGSGTFAVEAMIASLVPRQGRLLVAVNGAYGRRMAEIARRLGRAVSVVEGAEHTPSEAGALDSALAALAGNGGVSHLAVVHCETTSGVLNPLAALAEVARARRVRLLVDAMSSFGALDIDARALGFEALAASANKCLEGVPGLAFVIAETAALAAAAGASPSLSLDLHDQWRGLEANGQWRFTPPTHVLAALDAALDGLDGEGGVAGRRARYGENCAHLVAGMRRLGFETLVADADQAPIIVAFRTPADRCFDFDRFYRALHRRGFVIYPGKVTAASTFRIGCIGALTAPDIDEAVAAVAEALSELGVASAAPG